MKDRGLFILALCGLVLAGGLWCRSMVPQRRVGSPVAVATPVPTPSATPSPEPTVSPDPTPPTRWCQAVSPRVMDEAVLFLILRSTMDLDVWCDEVLARAEPVALRWRLEGR